MIPAVLKNMNAFVDGRGYAGRVEEIVPPKLVRKMEEFRGGGMDSAIELDMGQEKMEASLVFAEQDPEIFKMFGIVNHSAIAFQLRGVLQRDSDNQLIPVIIDLRGRFKELDPGTWKSGEKANLTCTVAVSYYRMRMSDVAVVEVDVPNMKCVVNGVDLLAAQRAALGL